MLVYHPSGRRQASERKTASRRPPDKTSAGQNVAGRSAADVPAARVYEDSAVLPVVRLRAVFAKEVLIEQCGGNGSRVGV